MACNNENISLYLVGLFVKKRFIFVCQGEKDPARMNGSKDILREKWVSVRGVETYTLRQGSKKDHNTIIIIIPGP